MFQNYFKSAWRNLQKHKTLNYINIFGLALGITTCLTILLYVTDEWSYDRYNEKADQIVRVVFRGKMNGELMKEAVSMAPVAAAFKQEFPEVLEATRLKSEWEPKVTYQDNTFRQGRFAYVDPNFFEVFSIPFLAGDPRSVLKEPNSIVISKELAERFLGKGNPIGKVLQFKEWEKEYVVTGMFDKVPANSHFHFDMFATTVGFPAAEENSWISSRFFTYLVLPKTYNPKELEAKFPPLVDKYMGPEMKQALGMNMDEFKAKGNELGLYLQPLTDIHLKSDLTGDMEAGGSIQAVYIFGVVAIFMLLIACINFMNLSTAGASKRAKEVGVRKVLGSNKKQLAAQFLSESYLSTGIAMLLGLGLLNLALPIFNEMSEKQLAISYLLNPEILIGIVAITVLVGLLAGSYPSFVLSSFQPINVLKKISTSDKQGKNIRSGLVVFQFIISAVLIMATLIVDKQLNYILNKNIGYEKDNMLVLRDTWMLGEKEQVLKNELTKDPRVVSITNSGFIPAGPSNDNMSGVFPAQNPEFVRRTIIYHVDDQYLPTLGMELVAGENFTKELGKEAAYAIINESAVKTFGLGENAVGKTLSQYTDNQGGMVNRTIVGVVKDFHFRSLHEPIAPLMMVNHQSAGLILRAKAGDMHSLIATIKNKWDTFGTDEPFQYGLLDQLYNETYLAEQRMVKLLRIFAVLTVLVACFGLFGLVTFSADQRTKEIGIRKVLGATTAGLVGLLSKDFLKLVILALIIASPLAYFFMEKWLQDFAYRIDISWWVFVLAGILAVGIAFLTVGFQSIKAALANPVESLRSE